MSYEQRDNSGALFRNEDRKSDRHPEYGGNAMIDGVEYYISAWVKDGKRGKFFSLAFKPKEEKREPPQKISERAKPAMPGGGGRFDYDDEIPFAPEFR